MPGTSIGLVAGEEVKAISQELGDKMERLLQTAQWQAPRPPRRPRPAMRRAASAAAAAPARLEPGPALRRSGLDVDEEGMERVQRMHTYTAPLRRGRLPHGALCGVDEIAGGGGGAVEGAAV
jgi:hypothetical protein